MRNYYKFYSANNMQYIEEVLHSSQLYMTDYVGMRAPNDVSEGIYWSDNTIPQLLREKVLQEKKKLMICCVTNKVRNAYMWQEFANNADGICLAFQIQDSKTIKSFKINYQDERPFISSQKFKILTQEQIAVEVLSNKLSMFSNEHETRILKRVLDDRTHDTLPVKIERLYLGWNLTNEKEVYLRKLASQIDIKVIKLHKPIS